MSDLKGIYTRLREERIRLGKSQQEFAEATGVTRATQVAYESGSTSPNVVYLHGIAGRGADIFYILSGRRDGGVPAGHVALERLPRFGPVEVPEQILLPEFLVRRKIGMTPIAHLRWAVNPSRAMEPQIERHALVLINVTESTPESLVDGATYAYALWGRPDVRRVLIRRDLWMVVGLGQETDPIEVDEAEREGLEIFGAVVGVL